MALTDAPSRSAGSALKATFVLTAGRGLAFAGLFFVPVVLARVFDQAEFGTYKQVLLIVSTLYSFGQLGMAESLYYFLGRPSAHAGRYVANSILFLAAAGLAWLGVLETAAPLLRRWMGNPGLAPYLPLAGAFLGLTLAAAAIEIVMISRGRYGWAASSYALSDLGRAAFFVLPGLLVQRLDAVLLGAVAFASLRLAAGLGYFRWEFGSGLRPDVPRLREQLAYALPFGLAILSDVVQANYHQYAVSYSFDAATFATYSVGCLSIPIVDFVLSPMASVMMVRLSGAIAEGDAAEALAIWHDTTRQLALLFVPLAALLVATGRDVIVLLFTERYRASVPIFAIWSSGIAWHTLLVDGVLRAHADTRFLLRLSGVRLLLNVALMSWFIGAFGLRGAVLVSVLSIAVTKALALPRVARHLGVGLAGVLPWRSLGGIALAAAAAAAAARAFEGRLELAPFPALAVTGVVFGAAYVALLLRFGLVRSDERQALTAWMRTAGRGARYAAGLART